MIFLLNLITVKKRKKQKRKRKKNFPWFLIFKSLLLNQSLFRDATGGTLPMLTEAEPVETLMYLHLPTVVGLLLANQML